MSEATRAAYHFGEFVLNLERGCLQRGGIDLELRPKAFGVLRHLVERAGKLVSKDELVETAWPNVAVSDDSLAQCVRDIRRLLDDDEQHFIRTVPRRGYMFVADVDTLAGTIPQVAVKGTGRAGPRGPLALSRWHFASFAVGFALPIVFLAAWMSVAKAPPEATKSAMPLKSAMPPYSDVLISNKTVIGQTIAYPSGNPLLKAIVYVSPPGGQFNWHIHQTPVFGYVLEGEITIDYGSKGIRTFRAGDALFEAVDWPHQASNRGAVVARILALNIGVEGIELALPAAGPK